MSEARATPLRLGLAVAGAIAIAVAAVAIGATVPQLTIKTSLVMLVAFGAALGVVLSGRPKEVLLAAYIVALTYNRQYFSFDAILGNNGSEGLYWVPGDPFLALLLMTGLLEGLTRGARRPPETMPAAAIALPALIFLVPFTISCLLARRPDLSFNELTRLLRFILVLVWLQRNMTLSLWYTAVGALGFAVVVQGGLGALQVALHAGRDLLSVFGQHSAVIYTDDGEIDELENRARGTLGHPNYLAPYLLTLLPACLGLSYYARERLTRLIAIGVLVVGMAGMVATKSRAPIALVSLAFVLVSAFAVKDRRLSLANALSGALLTVGALAVVAFMYREAIYERLWGDFSASVKFREEYDLAALEIWNASPLFGIGPNNATLGLSEYSKLFHWLAQELERYRGDAAVRAVAPVHNVYLLMLAETGVAGLCGFIVLLAGALRRAIGGYLASDDGVRGICLGLSVGLMVQFVQQTIDFSQWFDPSWYTLAVLMAVVGSVPAVRPMLR